MIIENSSDEATTDALPIVNTVLNKAVFRPMLFSTPMVQALLNGTKTQTRRLKGLEIANNHNYYLEYKGLSSLWDETLKNKGVCFVFNPNDKSPKNLVFDRLIQCSPINIGDIIWVRETFGMEHSTNLLNVKFPIYKTDSNSYLIDKWKSSLFMPKYVCRLWLKVTNVRIERLQDISEQDALNEGIICEWIELTTMTFTAMDYLTGKMKFDFSAKDSYKSLWEKINGKDSWDKNPWVFVYDFEVTTERPYGFI